MTTPTRHKSAQHLALSFSMQSSCLTLSIYFCRTSLLCVHIKLFVLGIDFLISCMQVLIFIKFISLLFSHVNNAVSLN